MQGLIYSFESSRFVDARLREPDDSLRNVLYPRTFVCVSSMTTVHDVPPQEIIDAVAADLKKAKEATPPEWAAFVKAGVHKEKAPSNTDWWYTRLAAVLRKVYVKGPLGTERVAAEYGGRRDRGSAPYHPRRGSRSVVRECLKQLESLGYVQKTERGGRVVSAKGHAYLDSKAHEVMTRLAKQRPELAKYM